MIINVSVTKEGRTGSGQSLAVAWRNVGELRGWVVGWVRCPPPPRSYFRFWFPTLTRPRSIVESVDLVFVTFA